MTFVYCPIDFVISPENPCYVVGEEVSGVSLCVNPEKVQKAAERARSRESPEGGRPGRPYADVAHSAFDVIAELREGKVLLREIAEDFAAEGLLPTPPDPNVLGMALKREARRRTRDAAMAVREATALATRTRTDSPAADARRSLPVTPAALPKMAEHPAGGAARVVNPDNTFNIQRPDDEDLLDDQ
jgi:hypothetical protein